MVRQMETRPRQIGDEDRLAKNARIARTIKATRARRKQQVCRTYDLKITENKLTTIQKTALRMVFLEAKWIRNDIIASGDVFAYHPTPTVTVLTGPDRIPEQRELAYLGSQMRQSTLTQVKNDVKSLAAKKNGREIGSLDFCKQVRSVDLKQYGTTYRFGSDGKKRRVKVQNIPGWLYVKGGGQITDAHEIANAKLVDRPDGYHLIVTTFLLTTDPLVTGQQPVQPGTQVGIDMEVKTHLTLDDGTKLDAMFPETPRLKRLRKKLSRQTKGSRGYVATIGLIQREAQKITRRKDDCANKVAHELLRNETVYMQDENLASWRKREGFIRGGKRLHPSILGRVKTRLMDQERVYVHGKWVATTATCVCGHTTKTSVDKRTFTCQYCGYTDDRDTHAAKNMIRLATDSDEAIPVERRELTRVESDTPRQAQMDFGFIPGYVGAHGNPKQRSL